MFETASPATAPLALTIGLVCLASGAIAMLVPAEAPEAIDELERSPAFTLGASLAALTFGAFVILFHRSWSGPLAIAVSLIGWLTFLEGLVLLGLPALYARLARSLLRRARAWGLVALLAGAALIAGGLAARSPIH